MLTTSVVIRPQACVQEHFRLLKFCPCFLHVSSLCATLPFYDRSLRLLFFTNEMNLKMPRYRYSAGLSYTNRSFSCCLTASTHFLGIPIKCTSGATSTHFKTTHDVGRRLFQISSLCVHEFFDVCRLKRPINRGGRTFV
jgi:hypothetical protein